MLFNIFFLLRLKGITIQHKRDEKQHSRSHISFLWVEANDGEKYVKRINFSFTSNFFVCTSPFCSVFCVNNLRCVWYNNICFQFFSFVLIDMNNYFIIFIAFLILAAVCLALEGLLRVKLMGNVIKLKVGLRWDGILFHEWRIDECTSTGN